VHRVDYSSYDEFSLVRYGRYGGWVCCRPSFSLCGAFAQDVPGGTYDDSVISDFQCQQSYGRYNQTPDCVDEGGSITSCYALGRVAPRGGGGKTWLMLTIAGKPAPNIGKPRFHRIRNEI
jgi:hypothetical protein